MAYQKAEIISLEHHGQGNGNIPEEFTQRMSENLASTPDVTPPMEGGRYVDTTEAAVPDRATHTPAFTNEGSSVITFADRSPKKSLSDNVRKIY